MLAAVNGVWSEWSAWTDCTTDSCSHRRRRTRTCSSPAPRHGGNRCHGDDRQVAPCGTACMAGSSRLQYSAAEIHFHPSDDMLARVLVIALCPSLSVSVCHKSVFCRTKIQRRATKMVKGLKKLPYETRLKKLGIYSLERRRLRGDLIETFKILTGRERVNYSKFFELAYVTSGLRGHSLKLFKPRCHTTVRQNFFSLPIVNEWNKLPQDIVKAPSINTFKNRLDRYWKDMGT